MVRKILSLILITAVLYLPICKLGIVSWFKMNQGVISKTLCVQKEVKKNTCNGHCVLSKKLAQVDQKNDQNPFQENVNLKEVKLFLSLLPSSTFNFELTSTQKSFYTSILYNSLCKNIDTPPPNLA